MSMLHSSIAKLIIVQLQHKPHIGFKKRDRSNKGAMTCF